MCALQRILGRAFSGMPLARMNLFLAPVVQRTLLPTARAASCMDIPKAGGGAAACSVRTPSAAQAFASGPRAVSSSSPPRGRRAMATSPVWKIIMAQTN
jgi:hypothetical protein